MEDKGERGEDEGEDEEEAAINDEDLEEQEPESNQ